MNRSKWEELKGKRLLLTDSITRGVRLGRGSMRPVRFAALTGWQTNQRQTNMKSKTPRSDALLMNLKATPEYTKDKDTDRDRVLYLCRELERGLNVIASMSGLTDVEIDEPRPLSSFLGEVETKIAKLQERAAESANDRISDPA